MIINNPPTFDHIVATDGEQLRPTVIAAGTGHEQVQWDIDKPVLVKTLDTGSWNMVTTDNITIAHGLDTALYYIIGVDVMIRNDTIANYFINLAGIVLATGIPNGGCLGISATAVSIARTIGGAFATASYDDAVINRGVMMIRYTLK